jgi:Periplasmic binding protein
MIISTVYCKVKMAARRKRFARAWGLLALVACCHMTAAAASDESIARGRRLFETGTGASGQPVDAALADSSTPIAGSLLSCAGCHGKDGRGRSVAGIDPPDITWQNLTKPYALQAHIGRSRLPYTEALVLRAVVTGRDSSNQLLGPAMPRFRLAPRDGADLLAYMRELGIRTDPGVTAQGITLGVVLRREGLHDAVRLALETYSDDVNRVGGVFGRRIAFAFIDSAAAPDQSQAPFDQTILAALVGDNADAAREVAALADRAVPLIAIRADGAAPQQQVFYLSAGLPGELGALAMYAARTLRDGARIAILHSDDDAGHARVAALRTLLGRNGGPSLDAVPIPDDGRAEEAMRQIAASDAVLLADRRSGLLLRVEGSDQLVLAPRSLLHALPGPSRHLLFAQEVSTPAGTSVAAPMLAAARLMVEGLRRAGRDVSRARLVEAIETIQRLDVGEGPPVSYSPRRHVGFTGAEITRFDPQQSPRPVGRVELD